MADLSALLPRLWRPVLATAFAACIGLPAPAQERQPSPLPPVPPVEPSAQQAPSQPARLPPAKGMEPQQARPAGAGQGPESGQQPPPPEPQQSSPRQVEGEDAQASPPGGGRGAPGPGQCEALPDHQRLTETLRSVVEPGNPEANGGLGNHMWAAVVDRGGVVCAVARTGERAGEQWPGSRAIALAKAFTANGFSLPGFALSTANLYWAAQPGGSLYAIEAANPVDPATAYAGDPESWGTADDPAVNTTVGGSVVFGGGLALYDQEGTLLGALGLSGDQSCTDHIVAWKLRDALELDKVPDGVAPGGHDNIILDITINPATGQKESRSGYGHPTCSSAATRIAGKLPGTHPIGAPQ